MKKATAAIKKTIKKIYGCAEDVYDELGSGWSEVVYQKAMEVALREEGICYEDQRILPISYRDHIIGEGIPDLVVWTECKSKKVAIVVDLKGTGAIKEDHQDQVAKYIKELKKHLNKGEEVFETGFVINFTKGSYSKLEEEEMEVIGDGVQISEVTP